MRQDVIENALSIGADSWKDYAQQLGCMDLTLLECLPDFLSIAPARTGTTWLSKNLNCHPEIFIPVIKEIRFFSTFWRWLDINWYLKHFQNTVGLKKGEATPSYAILPSQVIRLIKLLMPNIKLIFLMRDPVDRAWSHAKHNCIYREANFYLYNGDFESTPDQKFIENFTHEWPFSSGDYLGCLRRWLSYFPKEQFYLGFYESIKNNPRELLVEIFEHLGVKAEVDWSQFPISERVFPGIEKELSPNLKLYLRAIYRRRTRELALFLKEEFNLDIPPEWANTLENNEPLAPILIEESYKEFNIFLFEGKFYALSQDIGPSDIASANINEYKKNSKRVIGNSLDEAKYLVDQLLLSQALPRESEEENIRLNSTLKERGNGLDISRKEFDEQRLKALLATEIVSLNPQLLIESYKGFSIVVYRGKFYALALALGPLDLTRLEERVLNEYQESDQCFIASSLEEVRQLVDQFSSELPELVEEGYKGFNIVRYKGKFYALALALGPLDLTRLEEYVLNEYQESNQCFIGRSLCEAKHLIDQKELEALQKELASIKSTLWFRAIDKIKRIRGQSHQEGAKLRGSLGGRTDD